MKETASIRKAGDRGWPPLDQWLTTWGWLVFVAIAWLAVRGRGLVTEESGVLQAGCFWAGLALSGLGIALIIYAKLPQLRRGRLAAFGARAVPEERRLGYRIGYACVLGGAVLLAILVFGPGS